MKAEKVRNLTDDELRHQERELNDQLFKLKFQLNMGQTESLKKMRGLRKDIARVKTIARERNRSRLVAAGSGSEAMTVRVRSVVEVAGDSGDRKLRMVLPLGGATGQRAGLGDVITGSVEEASPDAQVQKGKVVKAVIVRTRKEHRRRDGTYIRFDQNAAVLINEAGEPVGTRVFGPVARELREKRFLKIVSLAPEVL